MGGQHDELAADDLLWGIDPALSAPPEPEAIWAQNVDALLAFLSVSHQWRCQIRSTDEIRWLSLDYSACDAGFRLAGVEMTPALWADVCVIEAGARTELNK